MSRCYICKGKLEQTVVKGNVVVTEPYELGPEVTMGRGDAVTGAKSYKKRLYRHKGCH